MAVLIGVMGVAPGVGKSVLCGRLGGWLRAHGRDVQDFAEEDILTRAEFAPLAQEFRTRGDVAPATILQCTKAFAASIETADVVVADALIPFTASLLAWGLGEDEVRLFLEELADSLPGCRVILIRLGGDPATALLRATAREQTGWIDAYLAKLGRRGVTDIESACAYLRWEYDVTSRLLAERDWPLITVDCDGRSAGEVADAVSARLAPIL